jgi:Uma2 family endonuclease
VETVGAIQIRRWSREEYEKMIECGVFPPGTRAELIDGEILDMAPQHSPHAVAISLAHEGLKEAFGAGYTIRPQLPLALDPYSEPEPDIAVVPGSARDYVAGHPAGALLVVEIADSSLTYDRQQKAGLYARAGIADYWIVNLIDRKVEIHRAPAPAAAAPFGWAYSSVESHATGGQLTPLAAPNARIPVADLLP